MQFCTGVDISDVVTLANFGSRRCGRFRMAGVEFKAFPLTFNVILITLWHFAIDPISTHLQLPALTPFSNTLGLILIFRMI